jgi:outer membrane receptor for ferrienterochelin and colicins
MRLTLLPLLLLMAIPVAAAESPCETKLKEASKSFERGRFQDVGPQLSQCWGWKVAPEQQARAYALLAQTHLALDELEEARDAMSNLLIVDPVYEPAENAPLRFKRELEEVRRNLAGSRVASVSKTSEEFWQTPATVAIVTAEEIERRGYLDLEAVLHDLPGFDISRGNGDLYSSVYPRGFRSDANDRVLFLVDGVEQNDLSSNAADISRQYPLVNIDRVEVVYGPSSTMYGANAFAGVINVITREPESYLGAQRKKAAELRVDYGSFDTALGEMVLAGRTRNGRAVWSLTGRRFVSDEMDLSRFDDWDYRFDPAGYGAALRIPGAQAGRQFQCGDSSPYYQVRCDEKGNILAVEPTPLAEQIARTADEQVVREQGLAFSDLTDDWSVQGKVRIENMTAGFHLWNREEGTASWSGDRFRGGADNGDRLTPRQISLYLRYNRWLSRKLWISSFTRYKQDEIDSGDSSTAVFRSFASGERNLVSLLNFCVPPELPGEDGDLKSEIPASCFRQSFDRTALDHLSTQLASEATWFYQPVSQETSQPRKFNFVGGFEIRKSSIQLDSAFAAEANSFTALAEPTDHTDAGLYFQSTWTPWERGADSVSNLRIVAGVRLDYSEVSGGATRDSIASPRFAVIYQAFTNLILKAIYTEAFKDPTDFERFSIVRGTRDLDNPDLSPERVANYELIAAWRSGEDFSFEVSAYQATYRDLVVLRQVRRCLVPCADPTTTQFQNGGELRVRGIQAQARRAWKNLDVWAHYTSTSPYDLGPTDGLGEPLRDDQGRPVDRLRVGDIASHRAGLGVHIRLAETWDVDLRSSYAGARRTGAGTTVSTNPFSRIGGVTLAHAVLAWRHSASGLTLRLTVQNLFDRRYDDPGVQEAGERFAARIPQPGRTMFFGATYRPLAGR